MGRRRKVQKREVISDPKYNSVLVAKFINKMMLKGKKNLCETILYSALDNLAAKTGKGALEVFEQAIENVKPALEVRSRRVGGATYQVPVEVKPDRQITLSLRWIVKHARARGEKSMAAKLSAELLDCYNNTGTTIKKREDTHRMADANKAFAHFKW